MRPSPIAVVVAAMAFALAAGCKDEVTPVRARATTALEPGADGINVLWFVPRVHTAHGELSASELSLQSAILTLDGATEEGVRSLRDFVLDERPWVKVAAARGLALASHADGRLALLVAAASEHPATARIAMEALQRLAADQRQSLFRRALSGDDAEVAQAAATLAPELLSGLPSVPDELSRAFDTADAALRATLVLGRCATLPEALRARALAETEARVLAAASPCAPLGGDAPSQAVEALAASLESSDDAVKTLALRALGELAPRFTPAQSERFTKLARAISENDDSPADLHIRAAHALVMLGDRAGLSQLAAFVLGKRPTARLLALTALSALASRHIGLNDPSLAPAVSVAIEDDDESVRSLAIDVAGASGDGRVLSSLVRRLKDPEPAVRAKAAYALGRVGAKAATTALVQLGIDDDDAAVRDMSFAALHHLVHQSVLPPQTEVSDWLATTPVSDAKGEVFWGRDAMRWRKWYQTER